MIRHTVAFTLIHPAGSTAEKNFLEAGRALALIPSVRNFECLRQISKKSSFAFGFSMEFDDRDGYEAYNVHPDHVSFVNDRCFPAHWDPKLRIPRGQVVAAASIVSPKY